MPDKKKIKENLEHERDILLEQLKDGTTRIPGIGREWQGRPVWGFWSEKFNDENPGTASEQYFKGLKEVE